MPTPEEFRSGIINAMKNLKKNKKDMFSPTAFFFTREQWLLNTEFGFTAEELDLADETGFIGYRFGGKCYIKESEFLPAISTEQDDADEN